MYTAFVDSMETVFKYWQRLFTLRANSYGLYFNFVKIAGFSAIYTTYCK